MKYARIQNGVVVDVRSTSPLGCFTDNIVVEFVDVPDEAKNGWTWDGTGFAPPPEPVPPTPQELADAAAAEAAMRDVFRKDRIRAKIKHLEAEQLMPRQFREFMLQTMEASFTPAQLATKNYYGAVKAFDAQITLLRNQLT